MANIEILDNNQEILGKEFVVYGTIDNPLFLAKDVAELLGNDTSQLKKMLDKVDDDEKVRNNITTPGGTQETWFVTEYGLYELLMQSRKPVAKQFKKEVKAILKQLRQCGVVITESATPETIDFQSKFGTRRIRKTFRESNDIEATWSEYKELSKIERDAHRIDNDDRLKACDIIVDELSDYIANNTAQMKTSKIVLYKEVIEDVLKQKVTWTNKKYGGKISNQTRKIKELEQTIEDMTPPERVWITVDYHGFSANYMFANNHKTYAYNRWIECFPVHQLPTKEDYEMYQGINFKRPIGIDIRYVCKHKIDSHNLDKSFLDQFFNRYLGVDDNIVKHVSSECIGYCDFFCDGKIIFTIYNL